MKLRPYTHDTRQRWIESGYNFIKLTDSKDISGNDLSGRNEKLLADNADFFDQEKKAVTEALKNKESIAAELRIRSSQDKQQE